jgi:hypothetical protein
MTDTTRPRGRPGSSQEKWSLLIRRGGAEPQLAGRPRALAAYLQRRPSASACDAHLANLSTAPEKPQRNVAGPSGGTVAMTIAATRPTRISTSRAAPRMSLREGCIGQRISRRAPARSARVAPALRVDRRVGERQDGRQAEHDQQRRADCQQQADQYRQGRQRRWPNSRPFSSPSWLKVWRLDWRMDVPGRPSGARAGSSVD